MKSYFVYSCYDKVNLAGESFIPDHALGFILAGALIVNDGITVNTFREGEIILLRRNHLVRFRKEPADHGPFESINIFFHQSLLQEMCTNSHILSKKSETAAVFPVNADQMLVSYMKSLTPYLQMDDMAEHLSKHKVQELLMILLRSDPGLSKILFDFSEPVKIPLDAFMEKNFRFNVGLKRLAYLTGRSLTIFKSDFKKVFDTTPGRWLTDRRLREAYYLLTERGEKPSDVYLDVGFEDLSHFSFVFKKRFGIPPSVLQTNQSVPGNKELLSNQ